MCRGSIILLRFLDANTEYEGDEATTRTCPGEARFSSALALGSTLIRQTPTASMLARFRLPAWSSVHAWLLRLRTGSDFAPAILPRHACLRLILFCTCPPLCAGVLWPMPAWVWRGVRSVFLCGFFWCSLGTLGGCATGHACTMMGKSYGPIKACHQATSIQSLTNTHIYVALSLQ